jgi:ABC-type phosphate/phosphonate transport system substrate-binding protein
VSYTLLDFESNIRSATILGIVGAGGVGFIPLEGQVQQRNQLKPLVDYLNAQLGVPVEVAITTSYAALVEAQRNDQVVLGYYGPLSFLFAEQRFGAVPILVDLAVAKGQIPAGASNNLSVDAAVDGGQIQRSDLVVLQTSPDIPNGPFAVSPKLDLRAIERWSRPWAGSPTPRRSRRCSSSGQ